MAVYLDKQLVRRFDVYAVEAEPQVYEGWLDTRGGRHALSVIFENDYYEPERPAPNDRNLYVDSIEVSRDLTRRQSERIILASTRPRTSYLLAREIMRDLMAGPSAGR